MEHWDNTALPILWLGLGLLLVFTLLAFILLIVKVHIKRIRLKEQEKHGLILSNQKELLKVSLETEERERQRIAHHLHDDLISQLYRIKLMCEDLSLSEMITKGIKTARNVSHELTPPMLNQLSIDKLMLDFLFPYQEKYDIHFKYRPREKTALSNTFKLHLLRIFQQLIINIDQHAKATTIDIILRSSTKYVCLMVQDNGIGYDANSKHGIGLKSITSRVQVLNGSCKIKKAKIGTVFHFISKNEASSSVLSEESTNI